MPFKDKLIKQMQKCIAQFSQNTSDPSVGLAQQEQEENKNKQFKYRSETNKHIKLIKPKVKNIYQLFLSKIPQQKVHIVNFYNMIAINEEAIRSQDFEESYCRTAFYLKSISKAQFRPNCLIFHLIQSNYIFTPIQYSIERFKSFGDQKFYNLACQMEEIINRFNQLKNHIGKQISQESNLKFDKYIQSLGNRVFVVRTSSKFILSKSFLELLEFNPQDYSIQAVKYRSSLYEGCSTKNYYQVMFKTLENIKSLIDLLLDRISLQHFLDNAIIRLKDYLYTKNNKKIYAKIKTGMPNPYLTIYQVEKVIDISDQLNMKIYFKGDRKKDLNNLKSELITGGIKTVRSLINLPPSYLPENQHKIAQYVQKTTLSKEQSQQAQ